MKRLIKSRWVIIVLILAFFYVLGTAVFEPEKTAGPKTDTTTNTTLDQWKAYGVNWNEYIPEMQDELAKEFNSKDCDGLLGMKRLFNVIQNDHKRVFGHNGEPMMNYVELLLKQANCYK